MIEYRYEPNKHRTVAYENQQMVGECTYYIKEGKWCANHTFVDDSKRGQGIAQNLLKLLVDQARLQQIKIVPVCSFVVKEFNRNSEYKDQLD